MKASPTDQRVLLDIAELDARIKSAEIARKNPPQAGRVKELLARRQELSHELTLRMGARDDVQTEIKRLESDVAVVDARRLRDEQRLQTVTNPKDAQGLESELESLLRRKRALEDTELELMERLEEADASVAEQERIISDVNDEGQRLSGEAKVAVAASTAEYDAATRDRAARASRIPAELLALYTTLATRSAGAALFRRQTCEGCRMMLSGTDLQDLRQMAADQVATCPECGCILVRTEESGV
ncbi:hypothetical protein FHX48_001123 [Microbacterium halimionae]|uniref:C4-type zinc ribbon domain-containing protein n=1 Tax=Microbacterium halimionae TaxID=1526413 RepID=A0A7W3JNF1_9MICO|nr:C4-type zinc ribbon domain-containing protein [Microbacterium halimionae]MBA8816050.1 hypothetical protein [Microbacterium halimionae]NII96252.1 hypothetical protein [Microbacterium halimionae]